MVLLKNFNGVAYFPEQEWEDSSVLEIFTDSVGLNHLGCEAYFQGHLGFSTMAYALDCSRNHERYHIPRVDPYYGSNRSMGNKAV